jgi:hypothetical protein
MEYSKRNSVADEFEVNKSQKFIWVPVKIEKKYIRDQKEIKKKLFRTLKV